MLANTRLDYVRTLEQPVREATRAKLEAVYGEEGGAAWGVRAVCDSLDECARLQAGEAAQLQALLVEGLQPLAEDPAAARAQHKSLLRLRSAFESAADRAAAAERKDVPPPRSDETAAQLAAARAAYRRAQLDCAAGTAAAQQQLRARAARLLLEWWMTRHAAARAAGATLDGALGTVSRTWFLNVALTTLPRKQVGTAMGRLEEEAARQAAAAREEAAQRQALEGGDSFCGGAVCHGNFLQGWLWQRSPGKLGMWTRRCFRVADGMLRAVGDGDGGAAVPLVTARVKVCSEPDRRNCFSVVGPGDDLLLQVARKQMRGRFVFFVFLTLGTGRVGARVGAVAAGAGARVGAATGRDGRGAVGLFLRRAEGRRKRAAGAAAGGRPAQRALRRLRRRGARVGRHQPRRADLHPLQRRAPGAGGSDFQGERVIAASFPRAHYPQRCALFASTRGATASWR